MFYLFNAKSTFRKIMYWVLPLLSLVLLYYGYLQAVAANAMILPTPVEIWERFVSLTTNPIKGVNIFGHIAASLIRVLMGAVIAWVLGVLFGIIIGWSRTCDAIFGSIFNLLRPIPGIAWIPLMVMSFGIGEFPKVFLVFIGCFIPVATNTHAGVKLVDRENVHVGRIFGASQAQILRRIVIPTALPSIFTGVRNSVDSGWKIILAAEMMGAVTGIGAIVTRGWNELDMAMVLVCIVLISLTGATLSVLIRKVERLLTPWER